MQSSDGGTQRRRRVLGSALLIAVSLATAGCDAASSGASPSASELRDIDALCAEDIVVSCNRDEQFVSVSVSNSATDGDILDLAHQFHKLAEAEMPDGSATLAGEADNTVVPDSDWSPPTHWTFAVYPGDAERVDTVLDEVLTVAQIPGTVDISADHGWPSVSITDLALFDQVFDAVSSTALFEAGGTYSLLSVEERLRIVHVPARTTDDAIHEIIDIARTYPAAEVLLEASLAGQQVPRLYVSRLTPEEVTELDTRLRDPRLAGADVDGYALEYVLGTLGEAGMAYTGGTFGDVSSE
jgi:hypothetical protein